MMNYIVENLSELNEQILFEMANIKSNRTGLNYDIWIDSMGFRRGNEHSYHPRIKVQIDNNLIPIDITDDPQVPESVLKVLGDEFERHLPQVKKWIKEYKEILLAHYYGKIDDTQAGNLLSTIGKAAASIEKMHQLLDRANIKVAEFYWDSFQLLYVVNLKNSLNEIIDTIFAATPKKLNEELNILKLENKDLKIIEIKEKDNN